MMKFLYICFVAVVLVSCNQQSIKGDGNITTETRDVPEFKKVKLSGSLAVVIKKGIEQKVQVETDGNIVDLVETRVEGDALKVSYKTGFNIIRAKSTVTITTPSLNGINISGSGNVKGDDVLESVDDISLSISGSGTIDIRVDAPKIDAGITGSGDIKLQGVTRDVKYIGTGSGTLHAKDLKAEAVSVKITGSGDAHVFASLSLDANITGSGGVSYSGSPVVQSKVTGSGRVRGN